MSPRNRWEARRLAPALGTEVIGLDAARPLADEEFVSVRGHVDHLHLRMERQDLLGQLGSLHSGHGEVGEEDHHVEDERSRCHEVLGGD